MQDPLAASSEGLVNQPRGTQPPQTERSATTTPDPTPKPTPLDALLKTLRSTRKEDRREHLARLDVTAHKLSLNNEQIDRVLEVLRPIRDNDTYQRLRDGKAGSRLVYENRRAATAAIEVLGFRKLANDLRPLPLEVRIDNIVQFIEGRASAGDNPSHASSWFGAELYRIGKDAVPFILRHAEQAPDFHLTYVRTLAQIGDQRAIDFILRTLRDAPTEKTNTRCDIIRWLHVFPEQRVIEALVQAMHDNVRTVGDARARQGVVPHHERYPVRHYPVRTCTASALSQVTGNHWGILFSEDPKTWTAWLAAEDRATFDPTQVPRTDEEVVTLVENFTFRCTWEYMRTRAWETSTDRQYGIRREAASLRKLGARVVPVLVQTFRSITAEFPVWESDLRKWTKLLLLAIDTPEARQAAAGLDG